MWRVNLETTTPSNPHQSLALTPELARYIERVYAMGAPPGAFVWVFVELGMVTSA